MQPPKVFYQNIEVTSPSCPIHNERIPINECWACSGNRGIFISDEYITIDCAPSGGRINFQGEPQPTPEGAARFPHKDPKMRGKP